MFLVKGSFVLQQIMKELHAKKDKVICIKKSESTDI